MNKKIFCALLCLLILLVSGVTIYAGNESGGEDNSLKLPDISAGNLVVVKCVQNGQVLFNTANNTSVSPTVSAKLMTAMLVHDLVDSLDESFEVSSEALKNIGAVGDLSAPMAGITAGNTFTVKQLLNATLVSVSNDACNALAYYVSKGDLNGFVGKMNQKAKDLGCKSTNYTNAVGLYDIAAYTTVEDVAIVAAEFFKYNTLLEISSQDMFKFSQTSNPLHNKNYLMSESLLKGKKINGAMGMIAGQRTNTADYCLITGAESDGIGYVYVIMNAPGEERDAATGERSFPEGNAYDDMKKIFNWAQESFGYVTLIEKIEVIGELEVTLAADSKNYVKYAPAEDVELMIPKNTKKEDVERRIVIFEDAKEMEAPVKKDTVIGYIELLLDGSVIGKVDLVTKDSVEKSELMTIAAKFKEFLYGNVMRTIIKVFIVIIVLYIIFIITINIIKIIRRANKKAERSALAKKKYTKIDDKSNENIDKNETEDE